MVIGHQGPSEGVRNRGGRATAALEDICKSAFRLNFMQLGTQRAARGVAHVEFGSRDLHGLERRGPVRG